MKPTKIYTFNLLALGAYTLLVAGEFFKILAASGSVRVDADFGTLTPIGSGMGLQNTPFSRLQFTDVSGGANTVTVVIGDENFLDSTVSSVTVTSTVVPRSALFAQTNPAVAVVSGNLLAANANRQYLAVQNKSTTGTIWINLTGVAATVANGIQIPPGGAYEITGVIPTTAITAIGDVANVDVVAIEG